VERHNFFLDKVSSFTPSQRSSECSPLAVNVRLKPDLLSRPRRAARSARHPVKVEIMGSNPIGGARLIKPARYANWQSDQAQTLASCGFDSHSCHLVFAGWCSSRRSVKPLPSICEAVGGRFNSFITHLLDSMAPSSTGSGHRPLKAEKRVQFPPGLFRMGFVYFPCSPFYVRTQ
jgi:hypothetical protein